MTGEFTLNSPLTKEDWDKLSDAELEHTKKIWFMTPSGKKVEYIPMSVIDDIKAEIRQKQWHIGVDSVNQVIEIISKYIGEK